MTTIRVDVPGAAYDVLVGDGVIARVGELVRARSGAARAMIVTDSVVEGLHGMPVSVALSQAEFSTDSLTVPAGETSKSWSLAGELLEGFARRGIDRGDLCVALGGGVVGDLAGFVAAVYLRGIDYVQVPTTLLAMVDSSVGGKTAVDLAAGKNLAGAFKQPLLVVADTAVLASLSDDQWQSGLAEVAKSAVLDGEEFLAWMEANASALVRRDPDAVAEAVIRCVRFKAGVVARDEREEGPRECLNYGHTLGHALETVLGYGTITHGAAVAEGMRFAVRLSVELAGADTSFVRRQDRLLDSLGLTALSLRAEPSALMAAMRGDKKSRGGVARMVLVSGPGEWLCERVVDETASAHLDAWASTKKGE